MNNRENRFQADVLPHLGAAYSFARSLSRSVVDADDIVQDAMLRAYRAFDRFDGCNTKAWLLTIVRNCWRSMGLANRRRGQTELDEALPATTVSPEQMAINQSIRRRIDVALAELPADFREILIFREIEDLSYLEIADLMGLPLGTIKSRIARARTHLRERIGDDLAG